MLTAAVTAHLAPHETTPPAVGSAGGADPADRRSRRPRRPAPDVLEAAEKSFARGFAAALSRTLDRLEAVPADQLGFACEGAAAASAILDQITLSRGRRLQALLAGPAVRHSHAVYLGAGRAYARLRLRSGWSRLHPLQRWAALDGLGFQLALTHRAEEPRLRSRAERAVADQGLGRFLWHEAGASPDAVAARIAAFPAARRGDLWSGVGYAATVVGGADAADLSALSLRARADGFRIRLAQGSAFAAAAALRSGHLPRATAQAVPVLAGIEPEDAAARVDRALIALGHDPHACHDYLAWQSHTRRALGQTLSSTRSDP